MYINQIYDVVKVRLMMMNNIYSAILMLFGKILSTGIYIYLKSKKLMNGNSTMCIAFQDTVCASIFSVNYQITNHYYLVQCLKKLIPHCSKT